MPYAVLGLLLAFVLLPLLAAAPASAAPRTITIKLTANGPTPASTTAAVGDTIRFTNVDATFVHEVADASGPWQDHFDSQPLAPGAFYDAPKLLKPGIYVYRGANLDSFTGKVTVPGSTASAAPAPAPSGTAGPRPSTAPPGSSPAASPAGSPSPTGGSGVVGPPPLAGGFGSVGAAPPSPGAPGLAPNVAPPVLPGEEVATPQPAGAGPSVAIGQGRLPEPPTGRRYGLPAALAAVAAAGVASLLVRLLLAHPAARRSRRVPAAGDAAATVD